MASIFARLRIVQASRLFSVLMLLQARGRLSAQALAAELDVSVRTIHRDIDQLSAAGVPVFAERGRLGGFQLQDGWRTRLTGLTAPKSRALFLSAWPARRPSSGWAKRWPRRGSRCWRRCHPNGRPMRST